MEADANVEKRLMKASVDVQTVKHSTPELTRRARYPAIMPMAMFDSPQVREKTKGKKRGLGLGLVTSFFP